MHIPASGDREAPDRETPTPRLAPAFYVERNSFRFRWLSQAASHGREAAPLTAPAISAEAMHLNWARKATHPDDPGSGDPVFLRIFNIIGAANDETTVELKGLVLTGGNASTSNGTGFDGGAIRSVDANLTVTDSFITGNQAIFMGGGAWLTADYGSDFEITNSTISGNKVTDPAGEGGGLYGVSTNGPAKFTIAYSTISDNRARAKGAGFFFCAKKAICWRLRIPPSRATVIMGCQARTTAYLGAVCFLLFRLPLLSSTRH